MSSQLTRSEMMEELKMYLSVQGTVGNLMWYAFMETCKLADAMEEELKHREEMERINDELSVIAEHGGEG